jgi:hypothetical protein
MRLINYQHLNMVEKDMLLNISSKNLGFDLKSINPELIKRYIKVKGRSSEGSTITSENEMNRLRQLGNSA